MIMHRLLKSMGAYTIADDVVQAYEAGQVPSPLARACGLIVFCLLFVVTVAFLYTPSPPSLITPHPIASLLPVPTTALSNGGEPVVVLTPTEFVVGPDFKLAIQSPKPGYVTVLVADEIGVAVYAPENEVVAFQTFQTGILESPMKNGTVIVFITPTPASNSLRERFPQTKGYNREDIPELKRNALEAISDNGYVVVSQITVERRIANGGNSP